MLFYIVEFDVPPLTLDTSIARSVQNVSLTILLSSPHSSDLKWVMTSSMDWKGLKQMLHRILGDGWTDGWAGDWTDDCAGGWKDGWIE